MALLSLFRNVRPVIFTMVIHQGEQPSFKEELAQDVLEIITVFSARLYGSRSQILNSGSCG